MVEEVHAPWQDDSSNSYHVYRDVFHGFASLFVDICSTRTPIGLEIFLFIYDFQELHTLGRK